jgi:hypothetical protein
MARMEVWNVCVRATGATVTRRLLFRAVCVGYLASGLIGWLGNGGADRFSAPCRSACRSRCPGAAGAEVPIIGVEVALAASSSFTLIGPLGAPGACRGG